jgi:hypothetical protein
MPGPVPGIHVLPYLNKDVDGRDKPGHDSLLMVADYRALLAFAALI